MHSRIVLKFDFFLHALIPFCDERASMYQFPYGYVLKLSLYETTLTEVLLFPMCE